jgi:hypothetical protein
MKTMTVTAILALIVGLPMIFRKCRTRLQPIRTRISKEERLYDIEDFVS